jgi:hypothetical protein
MTFGDEVVVKATSRKVQSQKPKRVALQSAIGYVSYPNIDSLLTLLHVEALCVFSILEIDETCSPVIFL